MKNDNEFLEFITHNEVPSQELTQAVHKDITLSFNGSAIIAKFLLFQLLGAIFSMSVCPQFGLGLVEGHGITHFFRIIGDWACAAFCGSLFLSAGLMVAFIGMKGEELWWVWRRYKYTLVLLPAILWSLLMLGNMSLNLAGESLSYHLVWIITAIMAQVIWMQMRSKIYILKEMEINP